MFSALMTPICHQFCAYIHADIDTNVQRRSDLHVVTSDCDFKFFKNLQKADYWDEPYRKHRLLTHVQ